MHIEFDIRKAIAATAFLVNRQGGKLDMFLGLKMLYLADKNSLIKWGKTITGDKFVSMRRGQFSAAFTIYSKVRRLASTSKNGMPLSVHSSINPFAW